MQEKISLLSIDWKGKNRNEYLKLLEKAIFALPLKLGTSLVLSTLISNGELENEQEETLLYRMLDKGVIYRGDDCAPGDWSNSLDIWLEGIKKINSENELFIDEARINQVFADVNQYLDGFSFMLGVVSHAWLFTYISKRFQDDLEKHMEQLIDATTPS